MHTLSFELILKKMALLDETASDGLLMAVTLAGQGNYQEVERLHDVGHWTNRLSVILPNNNIIRLVRIFAPYGLSQPARAIARRWEGCMAFVIARTDYP